MHSDHLSFLNTGLRWLYIDFNSYFASVEQELDPRLRGRPVAVVPVATDSTCAIAASYEAKAYGVKTGTPIWQAKKMCPGLICVLAQHEHYVTYHHRILAEIDRHIPVTAVCSIDEMACELMENEKSPAQATALAHKIKEGLTQNVGAFVRCSIGFGPNRYLAKVATDIQKPDGLTLLPGDILPGPLLSLNPRDLPGVGRSMEQRLLRANIRTMTDLWALSPKHMRHLWGSVAGERLWYQLRGVELPEQETTRRTIGHSHVLAPELRPPEQAVYVARRLVLKAASRLRRMGYYAGALSLAVRLEQGTRYEQSHTCHRAQDSLTFLNMLTLLWQRVHASAGRQRIKKVSVTLHQLTADADLQPDLFEEVSQGGMQSRARAEKLSFALDKINQKFGRDSIVIGMLPSQGRSFSGTKIAFTRIPDIEEFLE